MSTVFGWFNRNRINVEKSAVEEIKKELSYWEPDKSDYLIKGNTGFINLVLHSTPESIKEKLPLKKDDLTICFDGRIDNREELIEKYRIKGRNISDSIIIFHAFSQSGADCVETIDGDFAFSVFNHKDNTLMCFRDPIGVKPLYFYSDKEKFIFCSEIKGIISALGYTPDLDQEIVALMLANTPPPKDKTSLQSIYRLEPAHFLKVSENDIIKKLYWDINQKRELIFTNKDDYYEGLRDKFEKAVKVRLRSNNKIGAEAISAPLFNCRPRLAF